MDRKWIIATVTIAIVIVGFLGWYFLQGTQKAKTPLVSADVTINSNNYRVPIIWNLTAVPGATNESVSYIAHNAGANLTSVEFNSTIWQLVGGSWTEVWNGTKWFNGTSWVVDHAPVQASIVFGENQTTGMYPNPTYGYANKSSESATYSYGLSNDDQKIYLTLNYLGSNPTVDGQTVFAYVAFNSNGNGNLDASDKAFNFTSNPGLENDLEVYAPSGLNTWNSTPIAPPYTWNGSASPNNVPITVLCSSNRANITFVVPLSYIGAQIGGNLGFVIQAFGHNWAPSSANATTPSNYRLYSLSLPSISSGTFPNLEPNANLRFYTKVAFTSAASAGAEYSIVFEFQATVQSSS